MPVNYKTGHFPPQQLDWPRLIPLLGTPPRFIRFVSVAIVLTMLGGCAANREVQTSQNTVDACAYVLSATIFVGQSSPFTGFFPPLEAVNERNGDCRAAPPLLAAARLLDDERLPTIRHLLAQGADVTLTVDAEGLLVADPRFLGATPLHLAATASNRTSVLDMLIEFGADVAARTVAGAIPLHFAAAEGDHNMVELLLERGSDVNATDERDWTPLHYAARMSKSEEVVIALVDLVGADLEATTKSDQTAYDLILENPVLRDTEAAYLLEGR
ncbi:MAG: ankyrin repeat domain-containing protein [Gammaproteobacteria bacterium]|nr:ankyrin repeat domain-containing protein [Gammaproteobacteria bacterium]MDE2894630.1 ankyrin repeat domain-containing protein [Chloroflexota bacterium]